MTKTGIEYGDYNWSFYPGCLHKPQGKCPVEHCWAEAMWKRQMGAAAKKGIALPDFHHPHLIPERLLGPLSVKKPARILVNFMGDLFGDWVDPFDDCSLSEYEPGRVTLKRAVFDVIESRPLHTFIFLTKNPAGLIPWSPFPKNCRVGTTLTGMEQDFYQCVKSLQGIEASVKFISFEPLLTCIGLPNRWPTEFLFADGISWIIIGQATPASPRTAPKVKWIKELVDAADKAGCAVFLKNNLNWPKYTDSGSRPFYKKDKGVWVLRQEFPL